MILTIAGNGPLGKAILSALEGLNEEQRQAEASDPDLFMCALDCRAVVYAPASDLLQGVLRPDPDESRMQAVLRACNAPGVKLLVVVIPSGGRYQPELDLLVRHGVPYVIVEAAPLREELHESLAAATESSLWLARGSKAALTDSVRVAETVARALTADDVQGGTVQPACEQADMAEVVRSAAGERVAVHTAPPLLDKAARKVRGWLGLPDPALRKLCDQLSAV